MAAIHLRKTVLKLVRCCRGSVGGLSISVRSCMESADNAYLTFAFAVLCRSVICT